MAEDASKSFDKSIQDGRDTPQGKIVRYATVGRCIYCGDSGAGLTKEHIIPHGLGGTHILPQASCVSCARITGKIERDCLRTMFGDLRALRNIKRRKRKAKDAYIPRPMFALVGGRLRPYAAPKPAQRLSTAMMYAFHQPTILSGQTALARKNRPFEHGWATMNLGNEAEGELQAEMPDISRIHSIASFHPTIFSKMLAKIGYSYAVAIAGGNFKPIIGPAIVGKEPWYSGFLVGGNPNPVAPSKFLTELQLLRCPSAMGIEYLMARIRIFGDLGAPVYHVVVGEL